MSSNKILISLKEIGKKYKIYDSPQDRFKHLFQPILSKIGFQMEKHLKEFWALRDINLEIKKGEAVGIVGKNGSGKSTLLQIIAGTLTPSEGSVNVFGKVAALLELGSGFNPEFSGRENVYLNGALLGLTQSEINEKFDSIANFADIGSFIELPVKTYSTGMMLRLAFAVQVQMDPDILIVDEALAVGDAFFQKRCFQRIKQMMDSGVTVLFVTHDQETIRTITSRAIFLNQGRIVDQGNPSKVILQYRKMIHEEERKYYSQINDARTIKLFENSSINNDRINCPNNFNDNKENQFGEGDAVVKKVEIFNSLGEHCNYFLPQDPIKIRIHCLSKNKNEKLNVSLRIRNKEGIKIYSWGTLNQDMNLNFNNSGSTLFWDQKYESGQEFFVDFDFHCSLGSNLYEIQTAISREEELNYKFQRILHWNDESAFFQVGIDSNKYFFGGILDLEMKANWLISDLNN